MKNRPRLSAKSRLQLTNGIALDVPTTCELGCDAMAVLNIANVRICQRCVDKAQAIKADSPPADNFAPRHPDTFAIALHKAVA